MPLLPVVFFLAYQAVSRSARFALGWAIALFFGQIPGNKGSVLAIISLLSLAWIIVLVGGGLALLLMLVTDLTSVPVVGDVAEDVAGWQISLILGIGLLGPPLIAGIAEVAGFEEDRSLRRWLGRIPVSYPVVASLGLSILEMLLIAPVMTLVRIRRKRIVLQVPLIIRDDAHGPGEVVEAVCDALEASGHTAVEREEFEGPASWPLRTIGYAARHLIGSVVRGDPQRLRSDDFEMVVYATNVTIMGPEEEAHRVRAAVYKHLALSGACLTWSEESQDFEIELTKLSRELSDDLDSLTQQLDALQERIDSAALSSDEWNLLYRLRLQIERSARLRQLDEPPAPGEPAATEPEPQRRSPVASSR